MKKIIIIATALLVSLSFTSCTGKLDNPQKGVIDLDTYYANAGDVECEQLIAAVYTGLFKIWDVGTSNTLDIMCGDMTNGGGNWSDNANAYRDGQELILTLGSWPFSSERRGCQQFENIYNLIYRCNLIVENVPEQNSVVVKRVKAEAKVMRALGLWEAMKWYGTPPFADHIYGDEDMYASNGDPAVMIDWVLNNLKEASNDLPVLTKGHQAEIGGRFSAEAAMSYYGKVAIWYGTKYKSNDYIKLGQDALKNVINSGKYGLIDVKDLFYQRADFCEEYIFERNAAEVNVDQMMQNDNRHTWRGLRFDRIQVPAGVVDYSWGYCLPSKAFVEFMLEHHPDGENNPRLATKIISYDKILTMDYAEGKRPGLFDGSTLVDCVGWLPAANWMWVSEEYGGTGSDHLSRANDVKLRYADILLLYAEACVALNSDTAEGLKALNQVRERAGLDALSSYTYQDVKDERRAELYGERERWWDIIRWGDAPTVLKDAGKIRYEFYGYKADGKTYDIKETAGLGHGWEDKFLTFPFPSLQITANPNLKQNPGW